MKNELNKLIHCDCKDALEKMDTESSGFNIFRPTIFY